MMKSNNLKDSTSSESESFLITIFGLRNLRKDQNKNRIKFLRFFAGIIFLTISITFNTKDLFAAAEENKGFKIPGIGFCLMDKACLISHDDFMLFQFGLLTARAPGFVGLQISPFYNISYGGSVFQISAFNKANQGSLVQIGLVNKISDSETMGLFEFGMVNVYNSKQNNWIYGFQLAGLLNNHEKENGNGPGVIGFQFSGGFNSAKTVIGLQLSLDLHWLVAWLWDNPQRYISSAENVYGVQIGLAVNEVESRLAGIQIVPGFAIANDAFGIQLGLLRSVAKGEFYGLQTSLISTETQNDFYGLQASLLNNVKGNMRGLQVGIANLTDHKIYGLQIGLVNKSEGGGLFQFGFYNEAKGDFGVMQLGFVNNQDNGEFYGTQLGLVNAGDRVYGFQFGAINSQKVNSGLQLGIYNKVEKSEGLQIGLINFATGKALMQIGLINIALGNSLKVLPLINVDIED